MDQDFLEEEPTAFLLYHCDFEDGKQALRNRLFDIWHAKSNHKGSIYKYGLEVEMKVSADRAAMHYIGFLCKAENPNIENAIKFEQFSVDLVLDGSQKDYPS